MELIIKNGQISEPSPVEKEFKTLKEYIKESRKTRFKKLQNNKKYKPKPKKIIVSQKINNSTSTQNLPENAEMQKKQNPSPNSSNTSLEHNSKLKNQIKLLYHNMTNHIKKDNLFIHPDSDHHNIIILKDYHTFIFDKNNQKHNVSVRLLVGSWKNFIPLVEKNPYQFLELKNHFYQWLQYELKNIQIQDLVQKLYDSFLEKAYKIQDLTPYVSKLEHLLIQNLKKTSKQTKGFEEKLFNIFENWEQEYQEIKTIEKIENQLNLSSYENSFPLARTLQRKFTIYIGPTNSGKTYHALNELKKAKNGLYLAPLRLMAAEGQESLFERGLLANLITGEEQILLPKATFSSSTIEMCQFNKSYDCVVIDEIQMIADPVRGWAWSQALIGVAAKQVILVGSEESLPYIIPVIDSLQESYEIKRFERKTPLTTISPLKNLNSLKNGDCIVVFSRKDALIMKNAVESFGKKCSVIYGNLSPEVRRQEASKFKNGQNQILIATDAIGMGLNLPIQRLFFSTLKKFDGINTRYLTISEIKQIAGRAGRFGFSESGHVSLLQDGDFVEKQLLEKAIHSGYEFTNDSRIHIAPNLQQIQTICKVLQKDDLYSALIFFKEKLIQNHTLYKTANLDSMIEIAKFLKSKNFDLLNWLNYSCVPIDPSNDQHMYYFNLWIKNHKKNIAVLAPELPDVISHSKVDSYSLYEAENFVKLCMSYRWLHYKYPNIYTDEKTAVLHAKITNDFIEKSLTHHIAIAKNPKWKKN